MDLDLVPVPSSPNATQRQKSKNSDTSAVMKMSRSFIALVLAVLFASILLAVRRFATVLWSHMHRSAVTMLSLSLMLGPPGARMFVPGSRYHAAAWYRGLVAARVRADEPPSPRVLVVEPICTTRLLRTSRGRVRLLRAMLKLLDGAPYADNMLKEGNSSHSILA